MKIETITVMQRKNLGNYEHIEITASAKVEENDDAYSSLLTLKTLVHAALEGKAATMSSVPTAKVEEIKVIVPESSGVSEEDLGGKPKAKAKAEIFDKIQEGINKMHEATASAVKEKKTRAKKEIVEEVTVEAVIPEKKESFSKKNVINYESTIQEHKSILGGYLSKKYDTSWKTSHPAEEIKSFTASLNGKEFIDSEGHIVNSFLDLVHGFFGA